MKTKTREFKNFLSDVADDGENPQACWAMRKQGVAVRGVLKCGHVPSNYSKVRIVDIDYGEY
ncbi:hypothetical protein OESDEN_21717 [Oesophagostomum dentatum]|uniref:Uncharacterized protein n=1 Tax=Oesophagostomum dentatum TaxID=61180 RepID=A0A0B1S657_OESDE|nr:hypothetical protein OESDEN_21717 [Oesophagostomum dentatum]